MVEPSRQPLKSSPLFPDPDVPAPARTGFSQIWKALRHRNYRLFIIGQVISLTGTWMQNVALSWLVYRITHSELLLGAAWFCTQVPVFLLSPLGGLLSDRFPRRTLIIVTQSLSLVQACILAALTLSGRIQVWHILALAVWLGTVNAVDMPARQSLIPQLTAKSDLLSAISLNSAIFNGARIIGPGLAGFVVAGVGEGACFLLNALSFIPVIGCLLAMHVEKRPVLVHQSAATHLREGFRFAWEHKPIRSLLLFLALMTTSGMPALVLMPFFAGDVFHAGSRGLGILMGAMGAGAVVGTVALARRGELHGLSTVIVYSALTLAVTYIAFAHSPWFWLSLLLMPLIGFSVMRQTASANTLIQNAVPDHFRGRIMSLYTITVAGMGPFGSLAAGALAHQFGARAAVTCGGILALLVAVTLGARISRVDWTRV